ncbi:hypothetical protein BE08_25910 [Sorangium cellulosum]|uniref:NACHT domain-containing protein n=1 Tax=Sorangium cellulosum TaxID=56 RepID=A0A150PQA7_SORCE|nr:hypothetical protein BE08_25910 [Sorangium cellulosum]
MEKPKVEPSPPPEDQSYRLPTSPTPASIGVRLVLVTLPLLGGGLAEALGKPFVTWAFAHPGTAVPVLLVYVTLVLMAGTLRKVWERLEPALVDSLVSGVLGAAAALRARLLNPLSRYRRRYLHQIRLEHRNCNVRGLRIQSAYALRLADVFVELRIAPNNAQRASLHLLGGKELPEHRPIWSFIQQLAKEEGQALVLLGPPGSGKTTLLQNVALTLAMDQQRRHRVNADIPLLLFLRNHVDDITGNRPMSLGALAEKAFTGRPGLPPPPPGWFEEQLVKGRCIVLLDGLDEVGDEDKRRRVAAWTDTQIAAYSRSLFLLTARPMGYRAAPLNHAHVLEVLPFGREQVRRFVHNWYLANESMRAGGQIDEGVRQTAETQAQDLLARLRSSPALGDLTRNPLLVTMLATVHSHRNALPGGRVELYAEIADVLLGHWQRAKGIQQSLSVGQLREALEPLSAQMMLEGVRELRGAEVLAVIQDPLAAIGVTGEGVTTFLPTLQSKSGLLLELKPDFWGFAHLSFQEYFAACFFRKQSAALDWKTVVQDSWWHETLRLYAAQGDATALLQACLKLDTVEALTLASECLEEAQRLEPTLRATAEQRLVDALESADGYRRRLAAETLLNRRLRSFVSMDEERAIDPTYVTCAEYELFLNEAGLGDEHRRPSSWRSGGVPLGPAQAPLVGVPLKEAVTFVEWLNRRQGGEAVFRLPTSEEAARSPAVGVSRVGSWCSYGVEYRCVGLTESEEKSLMVTVRGLSTLPLPDPSTSLPPLPRARDPDSTIDLGFPRTPDGSGNVQVDLYHDIAFALLSRSIARSHDIVYELARTRPRARVLTSEDDRDRAGMPEHDLARAVAVAAKLYQVLNQSVDPSLDFALVSYLPRALDLTLVLDLARDPAVLVALAGAITRDLATDLVGEYGPIPNLDVALAPAANRARSDTTVPFDAHVTRPLVEELRSTLRGQKGRMVVLVEDLLDVAGARTDLERRQRFGRYGAHVAEYLWHEQKALARVEGRRKALRWFQRVTPRERMIHDNTENLLRLHWWYVIFLARLEGKLPAWEGIRLVRERRIW